MWGDSKTKDDLPWSGRDLGQIMAKTYIVTRLAPETQLASKWAVKVAYSLTAAFGIFPVLQPV